MNGQTKYYLGGSAIISLSVLAAIGYGIAWYNRAPEIPEGVTVQAAPAPEVKREEKIEVAAKAPVKVFKPGVKGKLNLPASVASNPDQHVIASSKTANDERQHTITTVIDTRTGESVTYDRVEPLPWVAVNTKSEVGAYVGLKNGESAIRIEGKQELLQVKALHVGALASADFTNSRSDAFVGIGVWARW